MTFTISGEGFTFTLEVDNNDNLTSFIATNGATTYNCTIQLVSQINPEEFICCGPSGCTSGPCR